MQPVAHGFPAQERTGFANEDKKGSLESIFGIVGVVQDPLANSQDHGAMPPQQSLKGGLFPLQAEALQQLTVRHILRVAQAQLAQMLDNHPDWTARHAGPVC